jgi:mannosyl-oligosaccharide alpha-1,2-mannosidase
MGGQYSVFEIVIRHLGGFLTAYQLTSDELFLNRALEIGEVILPLFKSTGLFLTYGQFDRDEAGRTVASGVGRPEVLLSDIGSIQLEFYTLSMLSGDMRFAKRASKVHKLLFQHFPGRGLYPERIDSDTWNAERNTFSIDAMSDSFYEYLIKTWILTNNTLPLLLTKYLKTTEDIERVLLQRIAEHNWSYVTRLVGGRLDHKMTHLATFAAGMLALGSVGVNPRAIEHLQLADELLETYVRLYEVQQTGLMPECVDFHRREVPNVCDPIYSLRPETVESLFVMYRFTGLQKYRDYAWRIFERIEKHCRLPFGYSGIKDVRESRPRYTNEMDSYFLAETLKYLYLIFSPSELLPLGEWVFNTEGHPFRVWTGEEAARMAGEIDIVP